MGDHLTTPARPIISTQIDDDFWSPRITAAVEATLPHAIHQCEATGRVANLARAGGLDDGPHEGRRHVDSDLFKVMEGLAWRIQRGDRATDADLDRLIDLVALAQEADGYLYTIRTIAEARGTVAELHPTDVGQKRWSQLKESHELYDHGHLFDLAAAHVDAVGPSSRLLPVAMAAAELILTEFAEGGRIDPPGHQGIELGLLRLHDVTGDDRLLALCRRLLDLRGHHDRRSSYTAEYQDHLPVREQREAVGHGVRLTYMAAAMAELGARTGDTELVAASAALFHDVVSSKMYLTGAVGIAGTNQEFGAAFDLADETAYTETCTAIGMAVWADALCRATGKAGYAAVAERALFNGLASGSDLYGTRFYYPNPLAGSRRNHADRRPWFLTACCPSNIARTVPSLHRFIAATDGSRVTINQLIGSTIDTQVHGVGLTITVDASITRDPRVVITVTSEDEVDATLRIRPPAWSMGGPVPSQLYRYTDASAGVVVDDAGMEPDVDGYLTFDESWSGTTKIVLELDLRPRRVMADERATALVDQIAVEYGPLVFCAESIDSSRRRIGRAMTADTPLVARHHPDVLGGVPVIDAGKLCLIPFAVRANRGPTAFRTWLRRS